MSNSHTHSLSIALFSVGLSLSLSVSLFVGLSVCMYPSQIVEGEAPSPESPTHAGAEEKEAAEPEAAEEEAEAVTLGKYLCVYLSVRIINCTKLSLLSSRTRRRVVLPTLCSILIICGYSSGIDLGADASAEMRQEAVADSRAGSAETEAEAAAATVASLASIFEPSSIVVKPLECLLVTASRKYKGEFTVTKTALVFRGEEQSEGGASESATSGGGDEKKATDSATDKQLEAQRLESRARSKLKVLRIGIRQIRQVLPRRYLLRESAIEVFLKNFTNHFFNFAKKERNTVYRAICELIGMPYELSAARRLQYVCV
jgi:hypothetical protein